MAGSDLDFMVLQHDGKLKDITQYQTISASSNIYAIDLANKPIFNARITTADAIAKSITVANIPTQCELVIEIIYTNAAAITWFANITWLNGIPALAAGKIYKILLFTSNGGTNWYGSVVGGW